MQAEFVQESVDQERPRIIGCLPGRELIVFQLEDEPDPDFSTAAVAP